MKVQMFYFDGCPSFEHALANLKQALLAEGMADQVDMIPVADKRDAIEKRFIGSPTIRLDDVDVEGPDADSQGYGFGCRVYIADGRSTGWPSMEQIRRALRASLGRDPVVSQY